MDLVEIESERKLTKNSITQSNAIVSAHYALSLRAQRLLYACVSQVNPLKETHQYRVDDTYATVTADQWAEAFGGSRNDAYKDLKAAVSDLYGRSLKIYGDNDEGMDARWISMKEYSKHQGKVRVRFTYEVFRELAALRESYTKMDMLGVCGLRSQTAVRLYGLAQQFLGDRQEGWRVLPLDELKSILGLKGRYPQFPDFRKRVLSHCSEVTARSDIELTWRPEKSGRKIDRIVFEFKRKQQLDMF